ncbi:MAG: hypothetical protein ACYTDU_00950 [Planctomycetota bacterium]|jgi:hypothetical protein
MHQANRYLIFLSIGLAVFPLPGCSSGDARVPDFVLLDVNPDSTTFNVDVSPRDHVGHTTAWYFGSAT